MLAFAPTVALPRRRTASALARPRVPTQPRFTALLRPGSRLRNFGAAPSSGSELALSLANVPAVVAPPPDIPSLHPRARYAPVRELVRKLVALAATVKRARERHARALRFARAAIGAALALVAVITVRGRGAALAGSVAQAHVSGAVASGAGVALPAGLGTLGLPEGVLRTLRPFTESFGVVFVSEFGDKSMFATALMAMKHSPWLVLIGALAALTVMTLIACFLGQLMHLLPSTVTHYSSIALFVFFGIQMLMQARNLPSKPGARAGERADAEELLAGSSLESANRQSPLSIIAKVSSLIFVAEWCDRSMIATMALAASSNSLAVVGGATAANIVCTGFAVGSAALVASRISERTVAIIAGVLFEFFAVFTFLEGPDA